MAAVDLTHETPTRLRAAGTRLDIFPGSSTPTVFAAGAPFWIGYGFVQARDDGGGSLGDGTRFELGVDGARMTTRTDAELDGERTVGKLTVASFEAGLPAGWHRFAGRWYVEDRLTLTSDVSIEFVES